MSHIDCNKCHEILNIEWDEDRLLDEEQKALNSHLENCAACSQYRREMNVVVNVAATLKDVSYERPVQISPLVLRPHSARPFWTGALVASGVAAVFFVGLFVGGVFQKEKSIVSPEVQVVRLVIPVSKAKQVEVVGDFTGWNNRISLSPAQDGLWVGEVKLTPGRYKYMIIVDDTALQPDPAAREIVDDGFGGKNSVLDVGSI